MTSRTADLPIGYSDFKEVREGQFLFVDKSLFIEEVVRTRNLVCLLIRPRRFGKTLNMSMLRYFFEGVNADGKLQPGLNSHLFEGLKVMDCGPEILKHMGAYPVVCMSLKNLSDTSPRIFETNVQDAFGMLYKEHAYLLEHLNDPADIRDFKLILTRSFDMALVPKALVNLCRHLYEYHGVKPIVLIDEYDHPINHAFAAKESFHNDVIGILRSILENAFKDQVYASKVILTGVARVGYNNLFSGINHFVLCTLLDSDFNHHFGFTEEEVKWLCDKTDRPFSPEVKDWYNGYQLPGVCVYNPWSVINYLRKGELKPYWSNTGQTTLIENLLKTYRTDSQIRRDMFSLIEGTQMTATIDLKFNYDNLKEGGDSFWMLLFFTGYLNAKKNEVTGLEYTLSIPNLEIRETLLSWIRLWFTQKSLEINTPYISFASNLLKLGQDSGLELFKMALERYMLSSVSYFDLSGESEHLYHVFMLGIFAGLQEECVVQSNRESGLGRYDVVLSPKNSNLDFAYIFEFKTAAKSADLTLMAQKAIDQIKAKKYETELHAQGKKRIIMVGIAFCGKQVEIIPIPLNR